ncbi:phagosome assembly factor 1 isoform X3 [Ixodes scapularis]|uniref:phagosome assembly factor 1 isoform X3 n=1 Tax=Ixodes scapularis TaxID=6945 RepID=UPI001C384009|nr:phagosome assembly factor 1 isoform X3 [Ixodes scapularis]
MLELDVVPEKSLGNDQWELVLGMAFSQVVHILQQQFRAIKGVQIIYNELVSSVGVASSVARVPLSLQNPLASDLVIVLSEDGIKLSFDPTSQRLKIIEVNDMTKVKLTYCGSPFCSPEILPTRQQIDDSFGATHPGDYDAAQQMFVLNFRGLSFSFQADPKLQSRMEEVMNSSLHFPNGTSPVVSRMAIYYGNSLKDTRPPPLPLSCFYNSTYLQSLEVLRENATTVGVKLTLLTEAYEVSRLTGPIEKTLVKTIRFGDTVQDVVSALGSPSKVFYKEEDKMKIHAQDSYKLLTSRSSDYFYNYFTLGMDVLLDANRHTVKKFVLHTNYPGHYNFNMYYRCQFSIALRVPPTPEQRRATLVDVADSSARLVTAFTKWDEIQERLVKPSERPVVLNRTSSTNTTNPFGPTYSYGYQDIIFEVMRNKHIASVTLYQEPACQSGS